MRRAARMLGVTAVMAVAVLVVFAPILVDRTGRMLMGQGDLWQLSGPLAWYMDWSLAHGMLPLWNPLVLCGGPCAANLQALVFYPPNVLRSFVSFGGTPFSTHVGMVFLIGAHLVMAGVATYYLARRERLSRGASAVAAIAFALNAGMTRHAVGHWAFVSTAAWFPVVVLCIVNARAATGLRRARHMALAGLAFGVAILAGFPQIIMYMGAGLFALWVLECAPAWGRRPGRIPVDLAWFAVLAIVSATVAAAILLPGREFASFVMRQKAIFEPLPPFPHAFSPGEMLRYLLTYAGPADKGTPYFVGLGVLFLACCFPAHERWRRAALVWGGVLYVLLDASFTRTLGPKLPVGEFLSWVAPFSFEVPERALLPACLPLALLAGFGVDGIAKRAQSRGRSAVRTVLLAGVTVPCLALAYRWTHPHAFLEVPTAAFAAPALLAAVLLASGWVSLGRLWRVAAPLLVLVEVVAWCVVLVPFRIGQCPYPGDMAELRRFPSWSLENRRSTTSIHCASMYSLKPAMNGYDGMILSSVYNVICAPGQEQQYRKRVADHECVRKNQRGYLFLKRPFWLLDSYVPGDLPAKQTLFPPTKAAFLPGAPALPVRRVDISEVVGSSVSRQATARPLPLPAPVVVTGQSGATEEVTLSDMDLPPMHGALRIRYAATAAVRLEAAFGEPDAGRVLPGREAFVPGGSGALEVPLPDGDRLTTTLAFQLEEPGQFRVLGLELLSDHADAGNLIRIAAWGPNAVEVEVQPISQPRLLLFVDAAYPGWRASVDGVSTPIYLANDAFKAVVIPEGGPYRVRFEFHSRTVATGLTVSCAFVSAVLVFLLASLAYQRRSRARQPARPDSWIGF